MKITSIRGFADILPGEVETWQAVEASARQIFGAYNFAEIRIPILEKTELFSRSIGETTDIVEKEMYTFEDRDARAGTAIRPPGVMLEIEGQAAVTRQATEIEIPSGSLSTSGQPAATVQGTRLTLRPEGTAGVVRAYVEAEMYKVEPVRKLYYLGPMFRRERPQKGRMRQFHQIGAEALGRGDPFIDAEILLLLSDFFSAVGLTEPSLQINSLGDSTCRPGYRETLLSFLRKRRDSLCGNCQRRIERNPLRALDCKEPGCILATRDAPSIVDSLCDACRAHFATVQRLLTETQVKFALNPRMVRGLDYYCRTTFEWTTAQLGAQSAVAAGGRYDGLVEQLGGPAIPGVGFAMGVERLTMLLRLQENAAAKGPSLYIVWLGDRARGWAFAKMHELRRQGLSVEMEGEAHSMKSQMRRADKLKAVQVLIVGDNELTQSTAALRNMANKQQREIILTNIEEELVGRKAP